MSSALRLVLMAVLLASTARADDSELFLSDPDASATRANILFIIDTSGSMATLVATQAPFDTDSTFSGCYDSDALYFSTNGAMPACDNPNVLPKAINHCAASRQQLANVGYYSDYLLAWDPTRQRWDGISPDWLVTDLECESVAEYVRAFHRREVIHATCEDYRAGATVDDEDDAADLQAGRKIGCPLLALWGEHSGFAKGDRLAVWRNWASDVRGGPIECGHFLPEEAPQATLAQLLPFLAEG